ncbi:Uncharacterised protein [Zhongshania aliphaticivorans]|uniref:Dehydrogenase n=1 Tax=Zhongshania aliphaticivorans TaxID=1470434 RepID=A0A5S9PH17_9GAMM|nr:DUF1249 domain-containing protein [Zhongshania aliphaticivorans]CAA0103252.1 Uncharacterised protein [Zhongshania aliphaticivorans]CAA0113658.1 Uncharacterised protein [Zhongshania aliphaticivorans]
MDKHHYRIDLNGHLADCEMNYRRLQKLLPRDIPEGGCLRFAVAANAVELHVKERAPYTTMIELRLAKPLFAELPTPTLQVRIYHDANLAEVMGARGLRPVKPRYEYPNVAMFHRDEKAQQNRYLGEWLSLCLRHGRSLENPLNILEI